MVHVVDNTMRCSLLSHVCACSRIAFFACGSQSKWPVKNPNLFRFTFLTVSVNGIRRISTTSPVFLECGCCTKFAMVYLMHQLHHRECVVPFSCVVTFFLWHALHDNVI